MISEHKQCPRTFSKRKSSQTDSRSNRYPMLIDHVSDLGRELLMHVRFRVYAVLFYSRLFVHWQRNSSPRWLRWVFTLGRNLTGSRRSKEYSELLEAQKAVYPFSINLTIIVFGLFLKLTDFPLALILYETGYFGSALLLIFVLGFSFWLDHKILGSDESQLKILKKMKTLPRKQLFWLMIQTNVILVLSTAFAVWLLIF